MTQPNRARLSLSYSRTPPVILPASRPFSSPSMTGGTHLSSSSSSQRHQVRSWPSTALKLDFNPRLQEPNRNPRAPLLKDLPPLFHSPLPPLHFVPPGPQNHSPEYAQKPRHSHDSSQGSQRRRSLLVPGVSPFVGARPKPLLEFFFACRNSTGANSSEHADATAPPSAPLLCPSTRAAS